MSNDRERRDHEYMHMLYRMLDEAEREREQANRMAALEGDAYGQRRPSAADYNLMQDMIINDILLKSGIKGSNS